MSYPKNEQSVTIKAAKTDVKVTQAVDANTTEAVAGDTIKVHKSDAVLLKKAGLADDA